MDHPIDCSAAPADLTRRDFFATSLKLGAAVLVAPYVARAQAGADGSGGSRTLNVALIGCGEQGRVLLNATLKIP
jgi:hypothetical protein